MTELTFRPAAPADTDRICEIILQAKTQMKALGSAQWQDGYPAPEDIARDIMRGVGWVLYGNGRVIAYGAVIFDGEPAYRTIDGHWLTERPYVVVHRLAVANEAKGQGIATEFMRRTETLARERRIGSFRVDTNFDNHYMLRMLTTLGFVRCGEIEYYGGRRIAFEKLL